MSLPILFLGRWKSILLFFVFSFFLLASEVFASGTPAPGGSAVVGLGENFDTAYLGQGGFGIVQPGTPVSVTELIKRVMQFLGIGIIFASVLGCLIGGSFLIFSGGIDGQVSRGKDILLYSIIGLSVTLLSYLIVTLVQAFLYSFS